MALLVQTLISGVGVGAVYALVAYGISLTWIASRTLNFAHGDVLMLGVFSSLVALSAGLSGLSAFVIAIVVAVVLGVALNKIVFYPLRDRPGSLTWVLGVVIFAAVLRNAGTVLFGARAYPEPFRFGGDLVIDVPGGAVLPATHLWVISICVVTALALQWLVRRTAYGRAVRALAVSRPTAELMGIDTERVMTVTFALAAGVGALAGLLFAPLTNVSVSIGILFTLKGFTAAVLGGISRPTGALVGGLVVGILENVMAPYVPAGFRDALVFALLIGVLVARPQGLFVSKVSYS